MTICPSDLFKGMYASSPATWFTWVEIPFSWSFRGIGLNSLHIGGGFLNSLSGLRGASSLIVLSLIAVPLWEILYLLSNKNEFTGYFHSGGIVWCILDPQVGPQLSDL